MLRSLALLIAAVLAGAFLRGGEAGAAAAAPEGRLPIRLSSGVLFAVPFGWHWTSIDNGVSVTLAPGEERREGPADPNEFTVTGYPMDVYSKLFSHAFGAWYRIERQGSRSYPNGATLRWQSGNEWQMWPDAYMVVGEIQMAGKALRVRVEKRNPPPGFSPQRIEEALQQIPSFLSAVPESGMIFHPGLSMAAAKLDDKAWRSNASARNFNYACAKSACGGTFYVYVYPSSKAFPDAGAALADLTGHFEKNRSLRIGPIRRESFDAGELAWTEQPGSPFPFLAAVQREGRYYFAQGAGDGASPPNAKARADFFAVLRSVQSWHGR